MIVLFLTNNNVTFPLMEWLQKREAVILHDDPVSVDFLQGILPDIIISYNYLHVIKQDVIDFMKERIINLHISLLPWNRGYDPNFWSFIENSPKGVTIHLLDKLIDTGDILLQKEVFFDDEKETLGSSYETLHDEMRLLFMDNWDDIRGFKIVPQRQTVFGTRHFKRQTDKIKEDLGQKMWEMPIPELRKYAYERIEEIL